MMSQPESITTNGSNPQRQDGLLAHIVEVGHLLSLSPNLDSLLQEIAQAIHQSLGFGAVAANLLDEDSKHVRVAALAGLDDEGRKRLEGAVYPWVSFDGLLNERFRIGHCYFVPHDKFDWEHDFGEPMHVGFDREASAGSDTGWHPNDALFVPIEPRRGQIVGIISVEQPLDGRRPDRETLQALEILAQQAASAIENSRLYEQVQREIAERKRVEAELTRRSAQLQTAAEVSRAAAGFLDPKELIQQVVNLVREGFGLYYAGLFLVDRTGQWAVLHAGTGEAGRRMVKAGHRLEVGGTSMIGWCVANAQARIALDVGEEAVRFDNPWLPETRSEMALPLVARGQIIGAMTIQSTDEAAFSDEDVSVLQSMADQLAIAIENARLFEQAQIRAEREQLVRTITDKVRRGTDTEAIMRITLQELGHVLGASKSIVRLGTQEHLLSNDRSIASNTEGA